MGALLVEEISGRPPRLSEDFPAIAKALAAIHALPSEPAPNPIIATVQVIERQAPYFAKAELAPGNPGAPERGTGVGPHPPHDSGTRRSPWSGPTPTPATS